MRGIEEFSAKAGFSALGRGNSGDDVRFSGRFAASLRASQICG